MEIITSSNVKNSIGPFMDSARKNAVLITKNGRPSVVALPAEEYERMKLDALRATLAIGEAQADRGEYVEYSLDDLVKELRLEQANSAK
ncbi:MAG: prevent-host-death protein [Methylophaga sp.]|nr:MAG: prevent-host-death protein [Methylophaga sp.]